MIFINPNDPAANTAPPPPFHSLKSTHHTAMADISVSLCG